MTKVIEFRNLNFQYDAQHGFKGFNFEINEGDIISLIGLPASGKTTLLKILCNKIPTDSLYYKGIKISNHNPKDLQQEIVVILDEPTTEKMARDEIKKFVRKLGLTEEEINERLKNLNKFFPLNLVFDHPVAKLKKEELNLVKLLKYLVITPKVIAIDNLITSLNELDKRLFFEYIKKNKITLLNVTTDLDDTLYGNKICVLDDFVPIYEGSTLSVLKTDTLLKRLGFKLPLAVNLSIELNNYEILKKIYKDNEKLVNALWK